MSDFYLANIEDIRACQSDLSIAIEPYLDDLIESFTCSKNPYHEDFLKRSAEAHSRHNTSRTYLLLDKQAVSDVVGYETIDGRAIAGYFTIAIMGIVPSELQTSNKVRKQIRNHMFDRNGAIGCYVLGELCRSDLTPSDKLPGSQILDYALSTIKKLQHAVGGRILMVDSRNVLYERLYAPAGFKKIGDAEFKTEDGEQLVTSFLAI